MRRLLAAVWILLLGAGCTSVYTDADLPAADRQAERDLRDSERAARRAEEGEGLAREIEAGIPSDMQADVDVPEEEVGAERGE